MEKSISGRGNSKCKGPEVGMSLTCLRDGKNHRRGGNKIKWEVELGHVQPCGTGKESEKIM